MSSSRNVITLYDISSRLNPHAWSPNTWKVRTVLNYKRIPYKTVWLSYPDIEPILKMLHARPTSVLPDDSGKPWYTVPALVDPRASYTGMYGTKPKAIVDSLAIAEYLDAKYPDRPVFPKDARARQDELDFQDYFRKTVGRHLPVVLIPLAMDILDERSKIYFRTTRELWYKKKLEEFSPEGTVRDEQWEAIRLGFDEVAARLDKNGGNIDFVAGGKEPTRSDLLVVSFLAWIIAVAPEDGWEQRVRHWSDGRWERLWSRADDEGWTMVH